MRFGSRSRRADATQDLNPTSGRSFPRNFSGWVTEASDGFPNTGRSEFLKQQRKSEPPHVGCYIFNGRLARALNG